MGREWADRRVVCVRCVYPSVSVRCVRGGGGKAILHGVLETVTEGALVQYWCGCNGRARVGVSVRV